MMAVLWSDPPGGGWLQIDCEDGTRVLSSVDSYCAVNADSDVDLAAVRRLSVGESLTVGGGAAPLFVVERIA